MSVRSAVQEALGLVQQGKPAEAVALLLERVKEAPADGAAWGLLGVCQSQLGQHAAARMAFQRAIELQPGDARLRFNYAVALERAGDLAGAAEQLGECLRHDPGHARARERLAALRAAAGGAASPAAGGSVYTPPPPSVYHEPARPPTLAEQMLAPSPGEAPSPPPPPAVPSFRPAPLPDAAAAGGRPATVACPSCRMHSRPGIVCEWCGASLPAPPAITPSRTGVASAEAATPSTAPVTTGSRVSPVGMGELLGNILQVWAGRFWVWAILLLCPAILSYLLVSAMPDQPEIARLVVLLIQLVFLGALLAGAIEEMVGGDVGVVSAVELFLPNSVGFVATAILYWLIAILPSTVLARLLAEPLAQTGWLPIDSHAAVGVSTLMVQMAIWLPVHSLIGLMLPISAYGGIHHVHALVRARQLGQGLWARHAAIALASVILAIMTILAMVTFLHLLAATLLGLLLMLGLVIVVCLSMVSGFSLPFVALAGCYVDALAHHPELAE